MTSELQIHSSGCRERIGGAGRRRAGTVGRTSAGTLGRPSAAGRRGRRALLGLAALLVVVAAPSAARAVIQVLYPLEAMIKDANCVFVAKVESLDPDKPAMVLTVDRALKGEAPAPRIPINLAGDKEKHTPHLLKRVAAGQELIVFARQQPSKEWLLLFYANGSWFNTIGRPDGDTVRWAFLHGETYLRRTYKGEPAELERIVKDALTLKKKPPKPDPTVPVGFGPELAAPK